MNIPPGFAQCNIFWGGIAMPRGAQTVIGVDPSALSAGFTPATVAAAVYNSVTNKLLPQTHASLSLLRVLAKLGPNDTGPAGEFGTVAPGPATIPPDSPQVAFLVKKITAGGGRQSRGRMFLPLVAEAQTDSGGVLNSVTQAAMQTALDEWLADLALRNVPMVLLHNAVEVLPTPVTSLRLDTRVATQRRRLRKVGGRRTVVA
jgi:hypothetical protein